MYQIVYYSDEVYENIENWPDKIAASYARITDRMDWNPGGRTASVT